MELEELGVNMRNWTDLAQDTDFLRHFANATLDLRVHKQCISRDIIIIIIIIEVLKIFN